MQASPSRPSRLLSTLLGAGLAGGLAVAGLAGPAAGAPHAVPANTVPAAASARVAQDLGYNYAYSLGIPWPQSVLQTPASIMTEVANNFYAYFPFASSCVSLPAVGGRCDLYNAGTTNPVRVVERTATSFTFVSLPGHAEGADRYIRFTFYKVGTDPYADLRLQAQAWGPWTAAAAATISSGLANYFWSQFAANVGRAYQ
jgi:hypothetical protein